MNLFNNNITENGTLIVNEGFYNNYIYGIYNISPIAWTLKLVNY